VTDWGGKVAAWFAGVCAASGTLAGLVWETAQPMPDWVIAVFVALLLVAGGSFVALLFTGVVALRVSWRSRRPIETEPAKELSSHGDQVNPQEPSPEQRGLTDAQFTTLRESVITFDKFAAIEEPNGRYTGGDDPNTVVLLHLPEVDQRLGQLTRIGLVNVPDLRWANRVAGAVVRARLYSQGFRGYTANERERTALRSAVRELRDLLTNQYPDLLRLRRRKEELERIGEFAMKAAERRDIGAPWTRKPRHGSNGRPSSDARHFEII
jgi:hypothetical protein